MSPVDDPELERWRAAYAAVPPEVSHPDAARWQAFFEGTLPATDEAATRDHIAACPHCAAIFKAARTAALAAAAPARVGAAPQPRPRLITVAATLSIAALAIVMLWPIRQPAVTPAPEPAPPSTAPPVSTPAAVPFTKPPIVISAEQLLVSRSDVTHTKYLEALAAALKPYQADDFKTAVTQLEPLAAQHPDRFEPAYYLGASLMLDGRARDAVPVFERTVSLASSARREEAERALAAARAAAGGR